MIDELRYHNPAMGSVITKKCTQAAADEIEQLRNEIERLRDLVKTYADMPFPCHDYMSKEQWISICGIVADPETPPTENARVQE